MLQASGSGTLRIRWALSTKGEAMGCMVSGFNKMPEQAVTGRMLSALAFPETALHHWAMKVWAAGCCRAACGQRPGTSRQRLTAAIMLQLAFDAWADARQDCRLLCGLAWAIP